MPTHAPLIAIVGGGPAGLMAAEAARAAGAEVDVYDRLGSVGRKFLIAGKGGLNLTHSEPFDEFVARYGPRRAEVARWLGEFDADALRDWARALGVETFVGSSGRVFPLDLKAAPLLRAWLRRLRASGVRFHMRHRWLGWDDAGALRFGGDDGERIVRADAVVLAVGGGSWSAHFAKRHAGDPVKPVVIEWRGADGTHIRRQGEFVVTEHGVEGSLIYALSANLRDEITTKGATKIFLDLAPSRDAARIERDLNQPRNGRSLSEVLRRRVGIDGVKAGLLREVLHGDELKSSARIAATIKALPLTLLRPRPIEEAISSAGGVPFDALDAGLMVKRLPGVFCAGEMIDWEAPTGGYLLTACFASGLIAGRAAAQRAKALASKAI